MSYITDFRPKMKNQNFLILRQSENFENQKKQSNVQSNQNTGQTTLGGQEMLIKQALDYKKIISLSLNRENSRLAYKGRCKKLKLIEQEQQILRILKQDDDKKDFGMTNPSSDDIEKLESPIQHRRSLAVNQINNGNYFSSAPSSGQKKQKLQSLTNSKRIYLNTETGNEPNTYESNALNLSMQEPIISLQQETPSQQTKLDISFPKIKSPSNQSNNIQRIRATINNNSYFPQNENIPKPRENLNKPFRMNKNELNKLKENTYGNGFVKNSNVDYSQKRQHLERSSSNSFNKTYQKIKNEINNENQYLVHKFPNLAAQSNILKSRNNSPKDVQNIKIKDITIANQLQKDVQPKESIESNKENNQIQTKVDNETQQQQNQNQKIEQEQQHTQQIEQNPLQNLEQQQQIQSQSQQTEQQQLTEHANHLKEKMIVDQYLENQNIEMSQPEPDVKTSKQVCLSDPSFIQKDEDIIKMYEKQTHQNYYRSSNEQRNSSYDQFYGQPSERDNYTSFRNIMREQKNMQQYQQAIINRIHHLEKEETKNLMKVDETRKRIFQILQDKINQQQIHSSIMNHQVDQSFVGKGNEKWNSNVNIVEKKNRSKSVAETRNLGLDIKRIQKIQEDKKKERAALLKIEQKQMIEEQLKKEQQEQMLKEQKCQKIKVQLQKSREQICKALQEKKFNVINQINRSVIFSQFFLLQQILIICQHIKQMYMEKQKNDSLNMNIQHLEEIEQNLINKLHQTQLKQQGVIAELKDALEMNPDQFCKQHFSHIKSDQEQMLTEQSAKIFSLINRKGKLF